LQLFAISATGEARNTNQPPILIRGDVMAEWFKFYSATIHDRRFKHMARETGQSKMEILGTWVITLALANDSPEPGRLLIRPDIPLHILDVAEYCGASFESIRDIFMQFKNFGLVDLIDGAWEIIGWSIYRAPPQGGNHGRIAILERDGYICQYCGSPAEHVDHVIPRCQGGTNEPDNLVASCASCNLSKGGRTPEQAGMKLLGVPDA